MHLKACMHACVGVHACVSVHLTVLSLILTDKSHSNIWLKTRGQIDPHQLGAQYIGLCNLNV